MSWFILFIAGLLEVVWAVGLKYTHGFSRLVPSVITIVAMVISMALLSWAMKTLPVGTAYAVWTGIGAVGAAVTGIVLLRRIRQRHAYCQPGVYRDWYHWPENQRTLIR
jgi:quaternary ammonium compound-resistance protein SugE